MRVYQVKAPVRNFLLMIWVALVLWLISLAPQKLKNVESLTKYKLRDGGVDSFSNTPCLVDTFLRMDPSAADLKRHIFCDDVAGKFDILCRWYLDQQNVTDHSECLLPQDGFKVPNIVFYITFRPLNFSFINFMCVLSAYTIQKARLVYVIGDVEPSTKWWRKLRRAFPSLRFIKRTAPNSIYGHQIGWVAHAADVIRLQVLIANGGIYMDVDQIFVNNFHDLRNFTTTMGIIDTFTGIGNAVIVAERGSPFLKRLYNNYSNYESTDYFESSLRASYRMWEADRKSVHLESKRLYRPHWSEKRVLYNITGYKWREKYAIHLWKNHENEYSVPQKLSDIDNLNTTLGEIFRHVYYNDSKMRGIS